MNYHPFYGISAPEKGWIPAPRYVLRRHRILKLISPLPRGRLLEIGCGAGALLYDLSRLGFTVNGLEISPDALQIADYINKDNNHVAIHQQAPDWDDEFDYILAMEVLEHIEDDLGALELWRNWLGPEGNLLISVPAHSSRWDHHDEWAGHVRRYDRSNLINLFDRAGFVVMHFECYGFPLTNIIKPVRAFFHKSRTGEISLSEGNEERRFKHTSRSGTERSLEKKLYPLQASWLGVMIMKFFCEFQSLFSRTNLGNGFLVLVKRK